jgi:ligand-binding sensor domain-containing protein/DNA-binding CsgD family transcriptional regulator
MLRKSLFFLLLLHFIQQPIFSQVKNIGIPYIHNFKKSEYKAGTQNWAIAQDNKGFMYFANNEGLLVFDGVNWQLFTMPNSSMVRSLFIDDDGVIYVGAYNDFGKMTYNVNGKMEFRSLKKYLPADFQNFDDIWNITSFENKIVYQSYNGAFVCTEDTSFLVIKSPFRFQNSFKVYDRLFFNDMEKGLIEFKDDSLLQMNGCESIAGEEIWSVMPYGNENELLICTLHNGLFIYGNNKLREWQIPVNEFLKRSQIFSAIVLPDKYYALGTIQDGVIIIDDKGNEVQHIDIKKGLQNNTILKVFSDIGANLWLGLDNGIDYISLNSPITFLRQPDGMGAGYTSAIFNGKFYLGTNQGLFVKNWGDEDENSVFRLIPNTYGQVWYLGVHDGILLCGHNNGTFIIEGETARQANSSQGGWKYHILKRYPGYLIGGTYSGLILFKKENGTWKFVRRIKGFSESFRVFEEDDRGDLWMSHGYKGIFRVSLVNGLDSVSSYRFYNSADGLPTNYSLNVYKIKNKILFTSASGIYEYNQVKDRFEPSVYFNQLLNPVKNIAYLKEDPNGDIWYVSNNKVGVFRIQEDYSYRHVTAPFVLLTGRFINGFEYIYPYSNEHLFFGIEDGFAHYSPNARYKVNSEFRTFITRGEALYLDSTFYYGRPNGKPYIKNSADYSFPIKKNAFRFSFATPNYDNPENTEYSYLLSGFNEVWSAWTNSSSYEFTNLPEGRFSFKVKSRNQLGMESILDEFDFRILPPWYKSLAAIIVYFVVFLSFVLLGIWLIFRRMEISRRKERLNQLKTYRQKEQEYIRQAMQSDEKITHLKNEKLRIEMINRNKELANQTMHLIRKNKFLVKIKEELSKLKTAGKDESITEKVGSIISKIDKDIDNNKQWEVFESSFDEVHQDFLNRLKTRYPALTPKELRLCAYLRMNISTKEIAPLMNISIRGVEICRYRVRKKMNIVRDTNLTSIIMDI